MHCDIIIPVYNNAEALSLSLPALFKQAVPNNWSIGLIISDDGSTDHTNLVVRRLCQHSPWPYQFIIHSHTGAAGARNRAITQSAADIVLLLGADIILRPQALFYHLSFHSSHTNDNQAALGIVKWDPRLKPSPFMEWMTHGGSQNDYDSLLGQTKADPRHYFYGSHLSLKKSLLQTSPFNEAYRFYGWEDIDLGRRLAKQHNLSLFILSRAIGLHRHYYSPQDIISRQKFIGLGAASFWRDHPTTASPNINRPLHRFKYLLLKYSGLIFFLSQLTVLFEHQWSTPLLYRFITNAYFWFGFHHLFPHKNHYIHRVFHNESTQ